MPWLSPRELRRRRVRRLWVFLALALALLAVTLADRWVWRTLRVVDPNTLRVKDWYQLLRQVGYLPTWGAAAALLALHDRRRWRCEPIVACRHDAVGGMPTWFSRAILLFLGAGLSGLAAEIVRGTVRRHRPGPLGGYTFDWIEPALLFDKADGFVSSHAGVAFGAAFMLGRLFPGTLPAAVLLAAGCGLSRLLMGAHFATDVLAAAALSYAVAAGLWRISGARERSRTTPATQGPTDPR